MRNSRWAMAAWAGLALLSGPGAFAQKQEETSPRLTYQGAWTPTADANASGGAYTIAATGASIEFEVPGATAVIYRKLDPNGGKGIVYVNGKTYALMSFYFPETRWQVPAVLDLTAVGPGPHKVQIRMEGDKMENGSGIAVNIDAVEVPSPFQASPFQQAALKRLNELRAASGMPPARLTGAQNLAAQAHAEYLINNERASHSETPGTAGFTGAFPEARTQYFGAGARAGGENVWPGTTGAQAITGPLNSFFHRSSLMTYEADEVGFGSNPRGLTVSSFGFSAPRSYPATRHLATYPADGQTGLPVDWNTPETPLPLPDKPRPIGSPISLHIAQPQNPTAGTDAAPFTGSLRTEDGRDVPVWLETEGREHYFMATRTPMEYGTTYIAKMAGTDVNGNAFTKEWKFKTVEATFMDKPDATLDAIGVQFAWYPAGHVVSTVLEWGTTPALGSTLTPQEMKATHANGAPLPSFYYTTLRNPAPGTYYFRATATDAKGGKFTTDTGSIVVPGAAGAPAAAPAAAPDRLTPGATLLPNNELLSPNRSFRLLYQPDGNLVLYRVADNAPIWASGTNNRATGRVVMQADGNLCMFGPDNNSIWHAGSNGAGRENSVLLVQDDGKVAIVTPDGRTIWSNGTLAASVVAPASRSRLTPGDLLLPGESLYSENRAYRLDYQRDGNLVLYRVADTFPLWASATSGKAPGRATMQVDGNLVVYGPDGAPQWASGTNGAEFVNSQLVLQTDGVLAIYKPAGQKVWWVPR